MKRIKTLILALMATMSFTLTSCESDELELLQGTWVKNYATLRITDSDWKWYWNGTNKAERIGTYTTTGTIIYVSIKAGADNTAYDNVYTIKTLNDEELVLVDENGDESSYTRQ